MKHKNYLVLSTENTKLLFADALVLCQGEFGRLYLFSLCKDSSSGGREICETLETITHRVQCSDLLCKLFQWFCLVGCVGANALVGSDFYSSS